MKVVGAFDRIASKIEGRVDAPSFTSERTSRFFSVAELDGQPVPPREWLVPDLIPHRNVTLLGGDGGAGKSLLALQLAMAVVAGKPWIGRAVTQGPALLLSAEDDHDELHRRLADITRAAGVRFADLGAMTIRSLAGEDALLAIETAVSLTETALYEELARRAEVERPRLIVLDTLADLYPGNENERTKVRQFITILRRLAIRADCAVVLLGHPSLTGLSTGSGTSGSTAWNNSVRSRLYLERIEEGGYEPDPDRRKLTTKKANYGRVGGEILVRWQDGAFAAEAQPDGLDVLALSAKAERVFLKLLRQVTAEGRRVNHQGGTAYAPKLFSEHPDREGVGKKPFAAAMNAMLARGIIVVIKEGPPSRPVTFLREVAE
jgi:RecA-family ATPase